MCWVSANSIYYFYGIHLGKLSVYDYKEYGIESKGNHEHVSQVIPLCGSEQYGAYDHQSGKPNQ